MKARRRWEGNIKMKLQEAWTGSSWFRIGKGTCECGNEPSGFIKCRECLDYVRTEQLLKRDSTPWSE
jgi:hypothetical protein